MEIKTLLQIKDEVAQRYGYKSYDEFDEKVYIGWHDDTANISVITDEIAKIYASQFIDVLKGTQKIQDDNKGMFITPLAMLIKVNRIVQDALKEAEK